MIDNPTLDGLLSGTVEGVLVPYGVGINEGSVDGSDDEPSNAVNSSEGGEDELIDGFSVISSVGGTDGLSVDWTDGGVDGVFVENCVALYDGSKEGVSDE